MDLGPFFGPFFNAVEFSPRWWSEFMTLPWPEKIAYRLVSFVPGNVSHN